jgi:DivIVA domain-containing protein
MEQVNAFLDAVHDTLLGVRHSALTAEEVRAKQFAVTRLRPGYDVEEVDAFLEDVEARLRVRCAECGAETAETTEFCTVCEAPAVGQRPVAADPSAGGPGDDLETVPAVPRDARRPPAWLRRGQRYFMISLIFFLILYLIAVAGFNWTQGSGLHHPMEWIIVLSVGGALLSLILFEAARNQFRPRQLAWGLVPILSLTFLAFVPFLWLALVRRRARDWVVSAAYLAAVATAIVFFGPVYQVSAAQLHLGAVVFAGLLVIAPVHAVLAFSPVAGPTTFREATAARAAGEHQDPVTGAVAPRGLVARRRGLTSRSGLPVGCTECGAPVAEVTQACAECGAPPVGQRT